jgi:hypothetical protein
MAVLALATPVTADDTSNGEVTLRFSQSNEYSDNILLTTPARSGHVLTTSLDAGVRYGTSTIQLVFGLGADLVGAPRALDDGFEVQNRRASLDVSRTTSGTELSVLASYLEKTLDDDFIDTGDGSLDLIDSGTRATTALTFKMVQGQDGPLETQLTATARRLDYFNTVDPDLDDEDDVSLRAEVLRRPTDGTTLRTLGQLSLRQEDDLARTKTQRSFLGFGILKETDSGLSLRTDAFYDWNRVTENGIPRREDGLGFRFGLIQPRKDGALSFTLASRARPDGRRTQANLTRDYETANSVFSVWIGAIEDDDDDAVEWIGGAKYSGDLSRGTLTARLQQNAVNDAGSTFWNTRLNLGYAQDINQVSRWQAGLAYTEADELGGSDDDSRASAKVVYAHDLTKEWSMQTGIEHVRVRETGVETRVSNTVFFTIGRDISFAF